MQIDGQYLGRNDQDFITKVSKDLETYLTSSNDRKRALLFPPLSSRHRFLIHKLTEVEAVAQLVSFSIGENEKRRAVVCFSDTLNSNQSLEFRPTMDDGICVSGNSTTMNHDVPETISFSSRARNRRPDKQLYVPRAKRSDEPVAAPTSEYTVEATSPVVTSSTADEVVSDSKAKQNLADRTCENQLKKKKKRKKQNVVTSLMRTVNENESEAVVVSVKDDRTCALRTDFLSSVLESDLKRDNNDEFQTRNANLELQVNLESDRPLEMKENPMSHEPTEEVSPLKDDDDCEFREKDVFVEEHASDCVVMSGPLDHSTANKCDALQLRRKSSSGESWDVMYDQSGECLGASLLDQLTERVGKVTIEMPQIDYCSFQGNETLSASLDDELGHVVEIHDFPLEFKTQDLVMAFSQFKDRGFDIKWVDDTHALGIFSSRLAAREALCLKHPFIKTRPLSQGTKESRKKAQKSSEFLQPYKTRPETSALLARRLVAGALGLQVQVSKEQREEDRRKLREAKERKILVVKQREAAWNGDVDNN